jgi:hypothetical protein
VAGLVAVLADADAEHVQARAGGHLRVGPLLNLAGASKRRRR